MSLIDRSFEEVCAIMDRTGDVVDLLVEHATDFRMCDLLDDNQPPPQPPSTGPRKSGDGPVGLGLVPGKQWEGMGARVIIWVYKKTYREDLRFLCRHGIDRKVAFVAD